MSYRNERYIFDQAGPEHSRLLLKIYESEEFTGNISVLYTRRPDPYLSLLLEGERTVIPIMLDREKEQVCGMGACVIRKVHLNGKILTAGYLTGMKSLPVYRRRIPHITAVYQYLHDQTKEQVNIYYTTILKENTTAQKMLEKKRKNMPEYRYQGEYTVYCFRTGAGQSGKEDKGYRFVKCSLAEVERFFQISAASFNFAPFGMNWHSLTDQDCYVLFLLYL